VAFHWTYLLPVLAGCSWGVIGLCYRLGEDRGAPPPFLMLIIGLAGTAFFSWYCRDVTFGHIPWAVFALGVAGGLGQYLVVLLIEAALRRGPLSPMWCVLALGGFLPVVLYSSLFRGEHLSHPQMLSVVTGVACVAVSSYRGKAANSPEASPAASARGMFVYAGILLLMMLCNSMMSIGMKESALLGRGEEQQGLFKNVALLAFYAAIASGLLLHLLIRRRRPGSLRMTTLLGLPASVGSVAGMLLIAQAMAALPSGVAFTVAGICAILLVCLVSVVAMGERAKPSWFAVVALGLATVILGSM
jgi:drug/metabolite transporter (DMT)-like permease